MRKKKETLRLSQLTSSFALICVISMYIQVSYTISIWCMNKWIFAVRMCQSHKRLKDHYLENTVCPPPLLQIFQATLRASDSCLWEGFKVGAHPVPFRRGQTFHFHSFLLRFCFLYGHRTLRVLAATGTGGRPGGRGSTHRGARRRVGGPGEASEM